MQQLSHFSFFTLYKLSILYFTCFSIFFVVVISLVIIYVYFSENKPEDRGGNNKPKAQQPNPPPIPTGELPLPGIS